MDKQTEEEIQTVFDDWKKAVGLALTVNAEVIAYDSASSTLKEIAAMRRTKFTKAKVDGITDAIVKDYKAGIKKGGSYCVEPIYEDLGNGYIRATTKQTFVPWLDDFSDEQRDAVMKIFIEGEKEGVYPLEMAKQVEEYFAGTRHRAQTAARTESQKIAQTARIDGYKESDVKYVQYITAADGEVRPTHEARHLKIYPINKAPWIGEYNCRCILTEADFVVEEEGAKVETDDSVIIRKEEVFADG
ncbi:MAG: minor capsid protein [Defluviitoga sp.]